MRERFNIFSISLIAVLSFIGTADPAGYTVKKADSVAKTTTTKAGGATGALGSNLVQTAITLGTGAMAIQKQTKGNTAECRPSYSDMKFINEMVGEVAKTGVSSQEFNARFSNYNGQCSDFDYKEHEKNIAGGTSPSGYRCYPVVKDDSKGVLGLTNDFIKADSVSVPDPNYTKGEVVATTAYDVWTVIMDSYFTPADLTSSEYEQAVKLTEKSENCSSVKLANKKKELWTNFATGVVGSIGKTTGTSSTESTMQQIQGLTQGIGSGSGKGAGLGNIMNLGSGVLGKLGQ